MAHEQASELDAVAAARAGVTSTGIGAHFDRNISPPDLDGIRWRLYVSDGRDGGIVEAQLADSEPIAAYVIPVLALQRVIERYAAKFPRESRLRALLAAGRIVLRTDHFRDSDFEPADSHLAA